MMKDIPPYRTPQLRRVLHVHSSLWHEKVSSEVSSVAYGVLWCLEKHGDVPQRELLGMAQIDKSSLAELLKRLEDHGLVTSRRDPDDKRRKVVSLTEEGRRIHGDLIGPATELNDLMMSGLTAGEIDRLDAILEKLLQSDVVREVE